MRIRVRLMFGASVFVMLAAALPAVGEDVSYGVASSLPVVTQVPFVPDQEADARVLPNHPPIDQIPFMPDPPPVPSEGLQLSRSSVLYDARSGEAVPLPAAPPSEKAGAAGGGYMSAEAVVSQVNPEKSFWVDMYRPGDTSAFPFSQNAKLVMRFVDTGGNDRWYVCSGSMIDAETVITASHCVYARDPDGLTIFNWAAEIWAYPGWDGVGDPWSPPTQPYGYIHGTYYQASSDWIGTGSVTYDVGLVGTTRAIGMLIGWRGWTWGYDCAFAQARVYYNGSYPAEYCAPGLHNGANQYFWWGTPDDCPDNRFHYNTGGGGCYNTVWGGMSGSGLYYIEGGGYYTHAVCSTSDRTWNAHYAKLWETFANDMNNSFIPAVRGATFDLQALDANAEPAYITAGQSLSTANVFMANPTNGAAAANWYMTSYLSTNNIISSGDTPLTTQVLYWDFPVMSSVRVNNVLDTIPLSTPSGSYWWGMVLDPASDFDSSNNATVEWDAVPMYVYGVADPIASWLDTTAGSYEWGNWVYTSFSMFNQGGDPSDPVTVEFRASTDGVITSSDRLLATYYYGGLGGQGTVNDWWWLQIPYGLAPGSYYIGMIVYAGDDVNASNNTAVDPVPISVTTMFYDGFESGGTSAWSAAVP